MSARVIVGDCLKGLHELPDKSVQCCVTSPPYFGLRDYGSEGQIGLEETPAEYIDKLVSVFREVWRVLRDDGTVWLNIGDSYAGGGGFAPNAPSTAFSKSGKYGARGAAMKSAGKVPGAKSKDLLMIPARVALALQADGWYLRSDIIWAKPNPMPESVKDRPTSAHEHVFLLTKSPKYFYDIEAVKEDSKYKVPEDRKMSNAYSEDSGRHDGKGHRSGGSVNGKKRNLRNVWWLTPKPYKGAHFAVFPPNLVERCVKAGSKEGDTILDPFAGSGTTGMVAESLGRNSILLEISEDYVSIILERVPNALLNI